MKVFVVIFHSGTNNINKTYLPEESLMTRASISLDEMTTSLSRFSFAFICSGCTRSYIINKRVDTLNKQMKRMYDFLSCKFIDNSNITVDMLKDDLHLNSVEEEQLRSNLRGLLY